MTERAQNAANRRFSQIHPFSWKFQRLEGAGNYRKPQIFAENRTFSQKIAGNRRLGSVTSPLARPYLRKAILLAVLLALCDFKSLRFEIAERFRFAIGHLSSADCKQGWREGATSKSVKIFIKNIFRHFSRKAKNVEKNICHMYVCMYVYIYMADASPYGRALFSEPFYPPCLA